MKKLAMIVIMLAITTLTVGTLAFEYSGQTAFAQVPPHVHIPPPCVGTIPPNPGSVPAAGHPC